MTYVTSTTIAAATAKTKRGYSDRSTTVHNRPEDLGLKVARPLSLSSSTKVWGDGDDFADLYPPAGSGGDRRSGGSGGKGGDANNSNRYWFDAEGEEYAMALAASDIGSFDTAPAASGNHARSGDRTASTGGGGGDSDNVSNAGSVGSGGGSSKPALSRTISKSRSTSALPTRPAGGNGGGGSGGGGGMTLSKGRPVSRSGLPASLSELAADTVDTLALEVAGVLERVEDHNVPGVIRSASRGALGAGTGRSGGLGSRPASRLSGSRDGGGGDQPVMDTVYRLPTPQASKYGVTDSNAMVGTSVSALAGEKQSGPVIVSNKVSVQISAPPP